METMSYEDFAFSPTFVGADADDEDLVVVAGRSKFLIGAMLSFSQQYNKSHHSRRRSDSVVNWAVSFEKILEDPLGLKTFTEFLKREFSAENIMFWIVCEHYRLLPGIHERKKLAKEIFDHYLSPGCAEPINIDSSARQRALDGLEESPPDLFIPAQKQIFSLMKFDCYQRFLKSDLFTESLTAEKNGTPYPCQEITGSKSPRSRFRGRSKSRDRVRMLHTKKAHLTTSPTLNRNKNSSANDADEKEEMDEKKRKSLLPWQKAKFRNSERHRSCSRSPVLQERNLNLRRSQREAKPRNRVERGSDTSADTDNSDASRERSFDRMTSDEGLSSSELSSFHIQGDDDTCQFCRITLPNSSTTVLKTVEEETVEDVVRRLMEKHGLSASAVDVFLEDNNQIVDIKTKLSSLSCKKLRVEKRIILRLELPSKKVVAVKAAPTRRCDEVLAPVLKRYGFDLQDVLLQFAHSNKILNSDDLIGAADEKKISVKMKEGIDVTGRVKELRMERPDVNSNLFDDVVNGRSVFWYDDLGVLDLEEFCRLPKESLMPGEISDTFDVLRRNSFTVNKENKSKSRSLYANRSSIHEGAGIKIQLKGTTSINQEDHQVETRNCNSELKKRDSADLTAVWSRAQKQLDDQRGTEINFELPEFLKVPDDLSLEETAG